jgi:hypothetical protein
MSEPQTETDAEPTGGPWEFDLELGAGDSFVWGPDGDAVAIMGAGVSAEEKKANARLIAAAGTAAQEAREMGYDPQKVVEALPVGLEQARCAIIDLLDGPPGETSAPAVKSAIKRLAFFLGEASNEEVSEIVDDKMLNDALASAEGSDQ